MGKFIAVMAEASEERGRFEGGTSAGSDDARFDDGNEACGTSNCAGWQLMAEAVAGRWVAIGLVWGVAGAGLIVVG